MISKIQNMKSYFKQINIKVIRAKILNFNWLRLIFGILLPPLIFSWPLLPGNIPFPLKTSLELKISESDQKIKLSKSPESREFSIRGGSIGGKDFFSNLFKIKISPQPINLCFNNYNRIYEGDKEINSQKLLDSGEAGAMNFKYRRLDNDSEESIYTKLGELDKCKILPNEGAVLSNSIEIRNPLPIKVQASSGEENISIKVEPADYYVQLYLRPGYYHINWQWSIFLRNFVIVFFGWVILLNAIINIYKWLLFKSKK